MPGQKRSRYLRQTARRRTRGSDHTKPEPSDRAIALKAASAAREKALSELRQKFEPKIIELEQKWAEKRREAWRDYEERKTLIHQAHLLKAKA